MKGRWHFWSLPLKHQQRTEAGTKRRNLVIALDKRLVLLESMPNAQRFQRGQDFTLCSSPTKLPVLGEINKTFEGDARKVKSQCAYVQKMYIALCRCVAQEI